MNSVGTSWQVGAAYFIKNGNLGDSLEANVSASNYLSNSSVFGMSKWGGKIDHVTLSIHWVI